MHFEKKEKKGSGGTVPLGHILRWKKVMVEKRSAAQRSENKELKGELANFPAIIRLEKTRKKTKKRQRKKQRRGGKMPRLRLSKAKMRKKLPEGASPLGEMPEHRSQPERRESPS